MSNQVNITLYEKDEPVHDPIAGFYTHYLLIANGFILAHFLSPASRKAYKEMLMKEGFQGFPENIMKTLFRYADPTARKVAFSKKHVLPEQTGFSKNQHEKVVISFRTYKVEICIYENIIFDPEINPYTQYVVTCNDFVIASFTHFIGASAYVAYLKVKGFNNFPSHVQDVIHFYSDPSKRLKNLPN